MPLPRNTPSRNEHGQRVYTTFRAYRTGEFQSGYKSFATYEEVVEFSRIEPIMRVDKVETTVLWFSDVAAPTRVPGIQPTATSPTA